MVRGALSASFGCGRGNLRRNGASGATEPDRRSRSWGRLCIRRGAGRHGRLRQEGAGARRKPPGNSVVACVWPLRLPAGARSAPASNGRVLEESTSVASSYLRDAVSPEAGRESRAANLQLWKQRTRKPSRRSTAENQGNREDNNFLSVSSVGFVASFLRSGAFVPSAQALGKYFTSSKAGSPHRINSQALQPEAGGRRLPSG